MAKVLITEQILQDTADAIREKTGSSEGIKPSEFPEQIDSLSTTTLEEEMRLCDLAQLTYRKYSEKDYTQSEVNSVSNLIESLNIEEEINNG